MSDQDMFTDVTVILQDIENIKMGFSADKTNTCLPNYYEI